MADVKLYRPQRLTDNPDGGGLATANEVVDGEINNLFDDISRVDRVNGELSLRKTFVLAATADTELYADVHVIVQAPPLDPRVEGVIFRTASWDDVRADAQSAVERYLDESVITRLVPYDRQLAGQRTVLVYQRPELALPEIGEVYALKNETTDQVEFVRIQDIDHQVETFTDSVGDYKVRVITLTIGQPLSQEFQGSQPNRYFSVEDNKSVVRKTVASDAARYKGVVRLKQNAEAGDLSIKVESVFVQLVPAATSEIGVADSPLDGGTNVLPAADGVITQPMTQSVLSAETVTRYLIRPAKPGTVVFQDLGGTWTRQDDGFGTIIDLVDPETPIGTVDYATGRLELFDLTPSALAHTWERLFSVSFLPAVSIAKANQTLQIPVEIANRGYVYVPTLAPIPVPGSASVAYRALGKWYVLSDDGTGALSGDTGVGAGLINFATGTVSTSLGALPDIGSAIIYSFGTNSEYEIRVGDVNLAVPSVAFTLAAGNCEPNTLEIEWESSGVTKTASDDGGGNITGDATGRVIYATGSVEFRPAVLPDNTTVFSVSYEGGEAEEEVFTPSAAGGTIVLALSSGPVQPGSLQITTLGFQQDQLGNIFQAPVQMVDDGEGGLEYAEGGATVTGGIVAYDTAQVTLPTTLVLSQARLERATYGGGLPSRTVKADTGVYFSSGTSFSIPTGVAQQSGTAGFINGTAVNVRYKLASTSNEVQDEEHSVEALTFDLTPRISNSVVPGSVLFDLAGRTYFDRAGTLYYGFDQATSAGTAAGTIDYSSGRAAIYDYVGGVAPAFDMRSLLTEVAPLPMAVVNGRTPGSPLRPGTFYIQANRYSDGQVVSGVADNNGNIDNLDLHGWVDVVNGIFQVAFGRYVLDSSLSSADKAQSWYDPTYVDEDGYIWRPSEVIASTVRFNCVVQTSLPQDPEIIKVNPVRLPLDGRVQAIRAGDTLVIHDPMPYTMPSGLEAGQVVALPRTALSSVALYDAVGLGVPTSLYSVDLAAGEVTMADPIDLEGYEEPLVAIHIVEDMALCLDAQITGEVTLGQALTHDYTAENSLCSSALILGDAQARYGPLFAQSTWTNVWEDELIGSAPSSGAKYNDALFPITVLNRDAITQRWRITFTSSAAFNIVGETLGVIGTGDTSTDVAPTNPATGQPYFVMDASGFGSGWSTGNVIRFNTTGAGGPIWVARTVRSGPATVQDDRLRLQVRWDKD